MPKPKDRRHSARSAAAVDRVLWRSDLTYGDIEDVMAAPDLIQQSALLTATIAKPLGASLSLLQVSVARSELMRWAISAAERGEEENARGPLSSMDEAAEETRLETEAQLEALVEARRKAEEETARWHHALLEGLTAKADALLQALAPAPAPAKATAKKPAALKRVRGPALISGYIATDIAPKIDWVIKHERQGRPYYLPTAAAGEVIKRLTAAGEKAPSLKRCAGRIKTDYPRWFARERTFYGRLS